ncbi:latexin [Xenopus laevis]|uniref:Cystatin LXN-type domain-containing protein n=2 Tax=Xenopus laevis TaxID=8355 RepID=A0A974CS35_XENLA|nr:latexin [Xenopus laevis]OCT78669.1 hypothetical protein XELAEV_18029754mg [Xenopus laevis]
MEAINPSHYPATRAATVAEDYINYKLGGPYRLFALNKVSQASRERIAGVGNKYSLTFSIEDVLNDKHIINCTAEVLHYLSEQHTAPNVTFTLQTELQGNVEDKDKEFYNKIRSLTQLLVAHDIPDKFGNVPAELEPIRNLALAACGFVKWQNSTENTFYRMAVIKSVRQQKREDVALEFHFDMLIHEMVSQEMVPWQMDVLWDPSGGLKIVRQVRLPKQCCCIAQND